jgi:hypothetical protein
MYAVPLNNVAVRVHDSYKKNSMQMRLAKTSLVTEATAGSFPILPVSVLTKGNYVTSQQMQV